MATATATTTRQEGIFLPGLARAFESIDVSGDLATLQFAKACEAILPVFDRLGKFAHKEPLDVRRKLSEPASEGLEGSFFKRKFNMDRPNNLPNTSAGPVFAYAKSELIIKRDSLEQAATRLPTLTAVVAADKKAGTVTTKNSCSRNLHRLLSSVSFISELLRNLSADSACTLHTAASNAYNGTMSPIHNFFVRTAVKTSMYTLPTRAGFLESIGETEDSARGHSAKFIPASTLVIRKAEALFGGTSMPKSDSTWTG